MQRVLSTLPQLNVNIQVISNGFIVTYPERREVAQENADIVPFIPIVADTQNVGYFEQRTVYVATVHEVATILEKVKNHVKE